MLSKGKLALLCLCTLFVNGCSVKEQPMRVPSTTMEVPSSMVVEESTTTTAALVETEETTIAVMELFNPVIQVAANECFSDKAASVLNDVAEKLEAEGVEPVYSIFGEDITSEDGVLKFDVLSPKDTLLHVVAGVGSVNVYYDTPEEYISVITDMAKAIVGDDVDVVISPIYNGDVVEVDIQDKHYTYKDDELVEVVRVESKNNN